MSDGSRLRQSWCNALNDAEEHFRQLLISSSPSEWKRVANSGDGFPSKKGKARVASIPEPADVVVHRNSSKLGDDMYRLVLEVPAREELVSLEPWKTVLTTPELRQEWDPAVEDSRLLEMFDRTTRISRTNFALGWPVNPRDAVTISRLFHDSTIVVDISTSLPRSPDEPAYLRPSPPYVRSHITLFAWCIQHLQPPQTLPSAPGELKNSLGGRLRITCFWQHDLKSLWNLGSSNALAQQLSTMPLSLLKTVMKRGGRVPKLIGYGNGVAIERIRFQIDREALTIDYTIIPEDEEPGIPLEHVQGMEKVQVLCEQRRLIRAIECVLPSTEGWDVQVSTKASSEEVEQLPWSARAIQGSSHSSFSQSIVPDQILLRLSHAPLIDDHSVLKVRVVIELSGPSSGLRLNGLPQSIQDVEDRDPSSCFISEQILRDVSSATDLSLHSVSSAGTVNSNSVASTSSLIHSFGRPPAERTTAANKTILSRVRRNYIYFSSLLQEPEAKWRRTTEARGVTITQLDSIDPTLVVYRAEAIFVGVGIWDLYGAVVSPGARAYWDRQHEDAVLLEHVNELTELWHYKTRPAWPANGRDSVVLKTVYKSPTTIHVFSFSAEDPHLFPNIPPVEPNVIRTQVDLQGWAIEALSPTTTLLTLLEQSDPKGWTNKTSIPTQMIGTLAGIGEFTIKCGGPPVVTRLAGAKTKELRYDHERASFKIEYEASSSRQTLTPNEDDPSETPIIECEIRCDLDTWASSLDIVVDPPPQTITCLRRHRFSSEGGGLWLTMTHDAMFVDDDRLLAIVRRGPGREKGLVIVNGTKVSVDVEELPEYEIKALLKRKRVKPPRIPLDQPPVMGAIHRRRAEWNMDGDDVQNSDANNNIALGWASAPRISSPFSRFFSYAIDQATSTTQQAVAAITPANGAGSPPSSKLPMHYALEALTWTQETHSCSPLGEWDLVNDKGVAVHRKLAPEISPVILVHKGSKVIEGVSAEELASVVTEYDCRKKWDDRYDSSHVLESFGGECRTSFLVSKTGFPWRDRGFYLASIVARAHVPLLLSRRTGGEVAEQSYGTRNAIFCVSASFSQDSVTMFSPAKYNSYTLPIGRVYVDAWVLETLDPYTKENYAIPSTRCTRLVAVDYGGSIPAAINSTINASLPRSILAVELYIKSISSLPITRLPAPCLVITDKKVDEHLATTSWKLKRRDESRVFVNSKFTSENRVYSSTILLGFPVTSYPVPLSPGQMTRRQSRLILNPNSQARLSEPSTQDPQPGNACITGSDATMTTDLASLPSSQTLSPRPHQQTLTNSSAFDSSARGHVPSPAFTLKGEVRPSTDLLVAELVIDTKLYPNGYNVILRSRMRSTSKVGTRGQYIPLHAPAAASEPYLPDSSGSVSGLLPLRCTIYTMPSSPLHSSGLRAESLTRHLVRLMLPTAQYQISTVKDPLTGETQSAPPKPAWMTELQEAGAIVDIEVRPAETRDESGATSVAGSASGDGRKKAAVFKASVNWKEIAVVNEKESLTSLGREELMDDRVSKMGVLYRIPNEAEVLPDELKAPLAIADDLLDPALAVSVPVDREDSKPVEDENSVSENSENFSVMQPADQPPPVHRCPRVARSHSGFLGFLQSYPNPLARFTAPSTMSTPTNLITATPSALPTPHKLLEGLSNLDTTSVPRRLYPMSTVLVVAVIAFLIGSLLRSLLSPADFIYVVTDLHEVEEANKVDRWREIRRLVEIKYIFGGWDFQVAVVRRH